MVPDGWVALATVLGTRGNKGEVVVELLTSSPDRFREVQQLRGFAADSQGRPLEVVDVWQHQGRTILRFAGISTISEAETLRGLDLCIPLAERRPLAPGEIFLSDWLGMELVDEAGRTLGRIRAWHEEGTQTWLELEPGGQLVPYVRAFFLSVDPAARRIVARLPEGLLELDSQ